MKKTLCLWMVLALSLTFMLTSCSDKPDAGRICYQSNGDGTCGIGLYVKDPEQDMVSNLIYMLFARFMAGATYGERLDSEVTEYVIPESSKKGDTVTAVGQYGFENWLGLKSVVIHGKVTEIEQYAFRGCAFLQKVDMAYGVTTIGAYAFSGCESLETIALPDSVTSIGTSAFEGCLSLHSIEIPASVTSIGSRAFADCNSLIHIYYAGTKEEWEAVSKNANVPNTATVHCNYN